MIVTLLVHLIIISIFVISFHIFRLRNNVILGEDSMTAAVSGQELK